METLDLARAATGVDAVPVAHRPRLLSDNGPCYISGQLATSLATHGLPHTRSAQYHPTTQGQIERYHCSLKIVVKLEHYDAPRGGGTGGGPFRRGLQSPAHHEALQNVTPADRFHGRQAAILARQAAGPEVSNSV